MLSLLDCETIVRRDKYLKDITPPKGWLKARETPCGHYWVHMKLKLQVYQTVVEKDGQIWMHTSVSRPKKSSAWKLPSYEDLARVRKVFVGDRPAIQIFPSSEEHVNLQNVLHLYTPLENASLNLPDFRIEVAPGVHDLA